MHRHHLGIRLALLLTLLWTTTVLTLSGENSKPTSSEPVLGILGAMAIEVEDLQQQLSEKKVHTVRGIRFVTGMLKGHKVVLALSGIGSVNAGVATALMLEHFAPTNVLFTGIAGGLNPDLGVCDIVIGNQTTYHDFGERNARGFRPFPTVSPIDGKSNPLSFPADATLLSAAEKAAKGLQLTQVKLLEGTRKPRVVTGGIVTGNSFVASPEKRDELRTRYKADATEMEGAAVAQICWQHHVPCLVVRSLSDLAGENATADYKQFEKTAAANSARLVVAIVQELHSK